MARPLRIDIEDGLYHVISRGWERRILIRANLDRQRWLDLLDRVAARCGWRIFAWILMPDRLHLYLPTLQPNLCAGMHDLNSRYASGFNRRYRASESLFQGRLCCARPKLFHPLLARSQRRWRISGAPSPLAPR